MAYRAIRDCFHGGHKYRVGESYTPSAKEVKDGKVPRHFVDDLNIKNQKEFAKLVKAAREEEKRKRVTIRAERKEEAARG